MLGDLGQLLILSALLGKTDNLGPPAPTLLPPALISGL